MRFRGITLFPYRKCMLVCVCEFKCEYTYVWTFVSIGAIYKGHKRPTNAHCIIAVYAICFCIYFFPFIFIYIYFLSKITESDTQFLIWMQSMHVTLFMHHSHVSITAKKVPKVLLPTTICEINRNEKKNDAFFHWNAENYCGRMKRQNATLV